MLNCLLVFCLVLPSSYFIESEMQGLPDASSLFPEAVTCRAFSL